MNNYYRTLVTLAPPTPPPFGAEALSWNFEVIGGFTIGQMQILRRRSGVVTTLVNAVSTSTGTIPVGSGSGELQNGDEIRVDITSTYGGFEAGSSSVSGSIESVSRTPPYTANVLWLDSDTDPSGNPVSIQGPGPLPTNWLTVNPILFWYEVSGTSSE
jgi:hypothetical protein